MTEHAGRINVEVFYKEENEHEIGFYISTMDNSVLTPQAIVDAIVEIVTMEWGYVPMSGNELDS